MGVRACCRQPCWRCRWRSSACCSSPTCSWHFPETPRRPNWSCSARQDSLKCFNFETLPLLLSKSAAKSVSMPTPDALRVAAQFSRLDQNWAPHKQGVLPEHKGLKDTALLGEVEQLFAKLMEVPKFEERIRACIAMHTFQETLATVSAALHLRLNSLGF